MKRKNGIFAKLYVIIVFAFFYMPILVMMIFSFNSSKSLTKFSGFSLRWYTELIHNGDIMNAVVVSVTIAIFATIISTFLGTLTAIGLAQVARAAPEAVETDFRELGVGRQESGVEGCCA